MKRYFPLVILMTALTAGWFFSARQEFWFDERFVQIVSAQPFGRMLELLRFENTPPFFFSLTWVWQKLLGSSDFTLRILSLVPTLIATAILYFGIERRSGRVLAILSTLLFAGSAFTTYAVAEFRTYTWVVLWAVLGIELADKYRSKPSRSALMWLAVVMAIGLLTHYTFLVVALSIFAWLCLQIKPRRALVVSGMLVTAGISPWYVYSLISRFSDGTLPSVAHVATDRLSAVFPSHAFVRFDAFSGASMIFPWLVTAVMTLFILGTVRQVFRRTNFFFSLHFVVFILGVVYLGIFGLSLLKYSMITVASGAVVFVCALSRLPRSRQIIFFSLVILPVLWSSWSTLVTQKTRYRETFKVMDVQPTDLVVIFPFNDEIAVRPYATWTAETVGFFPIQAPHTYSLEDIVMYNYRKTLTFETVNRLEDYVGSHNRVWFLYHVWPGGNFREGNVIEDWFVRHNYTSTAYTDVFKNAPPLVVRYDKVVP